MLRPRSTGSRKYSANGLKRETPMRNEHERPDMRHLWQGQVVEGTSMSLDQLRSALAKLNRAERVRTWVSGLFCLIFVGALGVLLTTAAAPIPIVRGGDCVFAL